LGDAPGAPDNAEEPLGQALARWRKRRKISGQELGVRVGMSQAKISRLETGASAPDPHDIRRIAEALELPGDEVERLTSLADRASEQLIDWQSAEPALAGRQHFVRRLESAARETKVFQPAVVPGLLQTDGYARAVLASLRKELADDQIADSTLAVSEAVAARMQRSQVLDEPGRQFHFLMTEEVVSRRVCRPADMLAQIARLREVAAKPQVSLRIIPSDAEWPVAPFHGFVLTDDRNVFVDLFNTSLLSRGRRTVGHYQRMFEALDSVATSDIDSILDTHQKRFVHLLPGAAA